MSRENGSVEDLDASTFLVDEELDEEVDEDEEEEEDDEEEEIVLSTYQIQTTGGEKFMVPLAQAPWIDSSEVMWFNDEEGVPLAGLPVERLGWVRRIVVDDDGAATAIQFTNATPTPKL